MYIRFFVIISPWKRVWPFTEQTWIPFTQVWLKMAQCFGREISSFHFRYFIIISPWKRMLRILTIRLLIFNLTFTLLIHTTFTLWVLNCLPHFLPILLSKSFYWFIFSVSFLFCNGIIFTTCISLSPIIQLNIVNVLFNAKNTFLILHHTEANCTCVSKAFEIPNFVERLHYLS